MPYRPALRKPYRERLPKRSPQIVQSLMKKMTHPVHGNKLRGTAQSVRPALYLLRRYHFIGAALHY